MISESKLSLSQDGLLIGRSAQFVLKFNFFFGGWGGGKAYSYAYSQVPEISLDQLLTYMLIKFRVDPLN